ncbi:MAG: glycosyltransferase family 4 protein [Cyanobacteria bacterium SBLK]|nr:glycosyltransferase family 4 protein [Cyanobacteria bacterium SBLK]
MKVLQINQYDIWGGAAIAAYRLHQGLLNREVDSHLLVGDFKIANKRVAKVPRWIKLENQLSRINRRLGLNYINILSSFNLGKHSFYQEADIVNFHNLHTGYFNYLALPKLTQLKPSVLSLHDMWNFTGHCAYSYDCDRWKTGCGSCPYPHDYPAIERDGTAWEWQLKNWVYKHSKLVVVANSSWMEQLAQQSILNRFQIHHIPLGIDINLYQPIETTKCKDLLGISSHKKVLMFAALNFRDPWKGSDLLVKILSDLPQSLKQNLVLLLFGNESDNLAQKVAIPIINLGYLSNDRLKAIAYSAADLFLLPSRAEAFGLVALEAAACSTPTVAFRVGGIPDIVRPEMTGYLAVPEDTREFTEAIVNLLQDTQKYKKLSLQCRQLVVREFSLDLQTQRYLELYQQILAQN